MPGPTTRILLIAGSDSSGGAGLEADQRVLAVHQCYAMTATTALTAQNTLGVYDIHHTPTDFVKKQIDACAIDIGIDVVKTGMLGSAETVFMVAAVIREYDIRCSVVDPVMVATSGAQLLPQAAVRALRTELLPLTTILTPNIPEARLLLQDAGQSVPEPRNIGDLVEITEAVRALGPKYVLLKGGHSPLSRDDQVAAADEDRAYVVDVLCGDGQPMYIRSEFLRSRSTHGTGCSLASAIACHLGKSYDVRQAVKASCDYVASGIRHAPTDIGKGDGPINHFQYSAFAKNSRPSYLQAQDVP